MHWRANAIQMSLGRLEESTDSNLMESSKNKWQNFHTGHLHLYKFIELNKTITLGQNPTVLYSYT